MKTTTTTTTKPFSLTYVRYPIMLESKKSSMMLFNKGKFLAVASLSPIFTVAYSIAHFLSQRELFDFALTVGIFLNECLAQWLKHLIKEERPKSCERVDFCDTHGMPSSHAQLAFFNSAVSVLVLLRRWKHVKKYQCQEGGEKARLDALSASLSLMTVPIAILVGYSRVELGYHTIEQVVAGAAIGLTFGSMWFLVTTRVFARRFSEMVKEEDGNASKSARAGGKKRRSFGKFLRETLNVRDSSLCANPLALSREKVELENFAFPMEDVFKKVD